VNGRERGFGVSNREIQGWRRTQKKPAWEGGLSRDEVIVRGGELDQG